MKHPCLTLTLLALALAGCQSPPAESETRPAGTNLLSAATLKDALHGEVDFTRHVAPILKERCLYCHQASAMPGRLSLASREEAMAARASGPVIVPGRPASSPLIQSLKGAHPTAGAMPAVGDQVTPEEVRVLERWVSQGAPWPSGAAGKLN